MNGISVIKFAGLFCWMLVGLSSKSTSQSGKMTSGLAYCPNYVYISGASNINQFTFRYTDAGETNGYTGSTGDERYEIEIPVKKFKPSNPLMYGDFLTLMKASDYPQIKVSFPRHLFSPGYMPESDADVTITIAGVTRVYNIRCSVNTCSDKLYFSGSETILISDFHLTPPQKLMGAVKVSNEIDVNFGFIITFTDTKNISATL